ncbi:Uncharacterized protein BP5553_05472 [Venustampulla echinocandica]|uniref:AB hydrolase-1 domain-containing protein n=1 Tax=Venustampulla echinocandica TaxID=2656787 RepID=A0A370TR90_9HELO|nr:Uncharacterized protein BP5553_05472 [Venustampulla echinocandica]RDL38039.1 Uncharacterized protein BP5553_05472 [Venustampulla echinocandica]
MATPTDTNTSTSAPTGLLVPEKPTIVIVQGSFQTPLVYDGLLKGLVAEGYPSLHPKLPSCTDVDSPEFPSVTLVDDALAVRLEVTKLVEYESKTVVVVMHSYGGLVGSEAVPEELSFTHRQAKRLSGGVIHLFYFSAFVLSEGQSVLGTFGESPNNDVKPDGRYIVRNGGKVLYNDLPEPEAALWESRLIVQSYNVQLTKLTRAAYQYISSTYLICENDQAAPLQFQEMFAATAKAHVERCSAGHSAMLSQPAMLISKLMAAINVALSEKDREVAGQHGL